MSKVWQLSGYFEILGYELKDWAIEIRFEEESWDIFLLQTVQTGPGAHPTSYSMATKGYLLLRKAVEAETHVTFT
jgi:hypothetical protein